MSKKILLVDDDMDLIEQYRSVLEGNGYQVETAYDSQEGYEKFMKFRPDLAILDLAMETFDAGFVLAHKIRRLEEGKKTIIYILTSAGKDTDFRFSVETSEERSWIKADGYLEKPIRPHDLLAFIRQKIFHEKDHQ